MENEIVFRALACALQRDGVASSLGDGFKIANLSTTTIGWSGVVGGERYRMVCYQDGITESGDLVEDLQKTTWIDTFH